MADKWLIAKDGETTKVLAQHGWTIDRRSAMFFGSEFEAQTYVDGRRINGHTARATAEDQGGYPGTPGAVQTEYDPYGLLGRKHS